MSEDVVEKLKSGLTCTNHAISCKPGLAITIEAAESVCTDSIVVTVVSQFGALIHICRC